MPERAAPGNRIATSNRPRMDRATAKTLVPGAIRQDFVYFRNVAPAMGQLIDDQNGEDQVRASPLDASCRFHTLDCLLQQVARSDEYAERLEPCRLARHVHPTVIMAKQKLRVGGLPPIVNPEPIARILSNLLFQTEIDTSGDFGSRNLPAGNEVVYLDAPTGDSRRSRY